MLMTNKQININNIFPKYLRGELSEKEQHDFEKLVMSDPFYADAYDGLLKLSPQKVEDDIRILNSRLSNRISKTDKRIWLASAASLLILVGLVSWLLFWMPKINNTGVVAKNDALFESNQPEDKAIASVISADEELNAQSEKEEQISEPIAIAKAKINEERTVQFTAPEIVSSDEIDEYTSDEIIIAKTESVENVDLSAAPLVAGSMSSGRAISLDDNVIADALSGKVAGVAVHSENGRSNSVRIRGTSPVNKKASMDVSDDFVIVRGIVTDEFEDPLSGVFIAQQNSTNGTVTDMKGNFEMKIPKTEDAILTASSIGYETQQFNAFDNNVIVLESNELALNEVIVTGYGVRTLDEVAAGLKSAYPSIGMEKYKKDVVEKLKQLNVTDIKEYKLTAKITVLTTGIVYNVEIKSPINERYHTQVIKVIKETSSWFPAKRNGASIDSDIKVVFKVK